MSPSSVALKLMMKGRTAVVTGAGGGLGRAYALELGRRGANVLVNDLSDEATTRVAQEIVAAGGRAETNTDNVVDSPEAIIASARNAFSGENAGSN
jgi:multifunctional beta-oxidation protein